jgi:beta-glucanase (GH16 family)
VGPNCGPTIAKPTGGIWTCTFSDDFTGTTLDTTKWTPQVTATSGYHSGKECFVNSPNNISVSGGYLNLTARTEVAQFTCSSPLTAYMTQYTSGMVSTLGTFSQTYGRVEIRAALTTAKVAGLQTSFWLWPVNAVQYGPRWPASGEIDIAEMYSQYWSAAIPYIHYNPATLIDLSATRDCFVGNLSQFHTYAAEWTPKSITIIYDGATCLIEKWNPALPLHKPQPFDQPFFLNLTQALGIGTNTFNPALTPLPAVTKIDYVHIWH